MLMNIIKYFFIDKSAMILEWIIGLFGLFLVILTYSYLVPFSNILINIFVENGAELSQMLFIRKMTIWGLMLFGVICLLYPFIATYRKIYDQGIQ